MNSVETSSDFFWIHNLEESIKIATKFTTECVRITYEDKNSNDYGVNFEEAIEYLIQLIKDI